MFRGIIIRMYWEDHLPPHFHAEYGQYKASYDLEGNRLNGQMPSKQDKLVAAWAVIRSEELLANWKLATNHEQLYKIEPLR